MIYTDEAKRVSVPLRGNGAKELRKLSIVFYVLIVSVPLRGNGAKDGDLVEKELREKCFRPLAG